MGLLQLGAHRLGLSTEFEPQALQGRAREGTQLKPLAELHKGRQPQGHQPLGDAIAEGEAKAHH